VRAGFGIPPHAPVVGTVGRLSEVKRQDVLLKAFARLQLPEVAPHLIIVGDGPLKDDLQQLAVALGVEDRVHFAGYQAHPERYLGAMNVFALTSRSEGMPLAILEAGAAGIPVVASRVGGVPELIQDGMTGLMFESGNDVALAARLTELLADPALMRRMGKAALDCVRSGFDLSVMAENYQRHYVDLLSEHRERRPVSKDTTRSYSVA
jgi:glycosyltransferase involved in cell wall biosynthesis